MNFFFVKFSCFGSIFFRDVLKGFKSIGVDFIVNNSFTKRSNPIVVIYSKTLSIANNEMLHIGKT